MLKNIPKIAHVYPKYVEVIKRKEELIANKKRLEAEARELIERRDGGTDVERAARVEALAHGRDVDMPESVASRLTNVRLAISEHEDAIWKADGLIMDAVRDASKLLCNEIKPMYVQLMTEFCAGMTEAHKAAAGLFELKHLLAKDGVAWGYLSDVTLPELGDARRSDSHWGDFFREAAEKGYCKLPKELA